MAERFQFLNNEIDISDFYERLPTILKDLIAEAEQLDREGNDAKLDGICEAIEVYGKLLLPDVLSVEQWERLCDKYYPY